MNDLFFFMQMILPFIIVGLIVGLFTFLIERR